MPTALIVLEIGGTNKKLGTHVERDESYPNLAIHFRYHYENMSKQYLAGFTALKTIIFR